MQPIRRVKSITEAVQCADSEAMKMATASENPYTNFAISIRPLDHQFL